VDRVGGDIEMNDASAIVSQNQECAKNLKPDRASTFFFENLLGA
jgi:hypothetical protein